MAASYDLNIHELLAKMISTTDEVILISNTEIIPEKGPQILYANPAYYHLLGRSNPEQSQDAQYLYDHLTPIDANDFIKVLSHLSIQEDAWVNFHFNRDKTQQIRLRLAPLSDTNHCYQAVLFRQEATADPSQPANLSLPVGQPHFNARQGATDNGKVMLPRGYQSTPEHNLQTLIDALPGIVFSANGDLNWTKRSLSQGCLRLTGYHPQELLGDSTLTYNTLIDPQDLSQLLAAIAAAVKGDSFYAVEYRIHTKLGQIKWFLEQGSTVVNAQGKVLGLEGFITDISELKQAEAQLKHDAFYDKLTGLPNRSLFMNHLEYCIKRVKRHPDQIFAVLFLDLDRFKVVNDSLGHAAGDQLLVTIAERLRSCVRETDTLARLGGDEFTILLEGVKDLSDALHVCNRIQQAVNQPFILNGREVLTTVSTGVALSTMGYDDPEQLLHNADAAMYRAKTLGKAQWEVFTADMHSNASALLQLEVDLRKAVDRQEFQLHYQPIYHLETTQIVGFEALLRWHHPLRGLVSPAEFIPVAEDTGLILPISWWVLQEACRQLHQWQQAYPADTPLFVSVNFSSKQFTEVGLISRIEKILQETGLAPQSLKLEITESAIMEHAESTAAKLLEIKALGIQLGIDDFGTGYSSLSYLHRFPVDILKIDRSFVSAMDSHENLQIVSTIAILSQNLGMRAVAEGVETAEQAAQLRAMGCQYAQGYFFSRPIDASGIERLLTEHSQMRQLTSTTSPLARLRLRVNTAYSYRPLVGKTSWIIGASQESDLLLAATHVAPKHAMVQLMGTGNYYLVNLSAQADVLVNGQFITRPTLLQEGDRILIGTTDLVFETQTISSERHEYFGNSVLMSHSSRFQGETWQAALTSQGLSVMWQAPEISLMQTLEHMQTAGCVLPALLLVDLQTLPEGLEPFCQWRQTHYPEIPVIFTKGYQTEVSLSEHQKALDYGAVDVLPGFCEQNLLSNLVDTLTKIDVVLQFLNRPSLDRKSLVAALMPLQTVVKQGIFQ